MTSLPEIQRLDRLVAELREGMVVDYCSVIGEPATQHDMIVRAGPQQLPSGQWVVWLKGKAGCVAVEACVNARQP